jgi:hypothetical protein
LMTNSLKIASKPKESKKRTELKERDLGAKKVRFNAFWEVMRLNQNKVKSMKADLVQDLMRNLGLKRNLYRKSQATKKLLLLSNGKKSAAG